MIKITKQHKKTNCSFEIWLEFCVFVGTGGAGDELSDHGITTAYVLTAELGEDFIDQWRNKYSSFIYNYKEMNAFLKTWHANQK